jgi:hypothetical protein
VRFAIIFSCFLSVATISVYSIVMNQITAMEDFYGNMDKYASESLNTNNSVENPYAPQPLKDMSQPLNR